MRLEPSDLEVLKPMIAAAIREVLDETEADMVRLDGRLAYNEAEAAALLGIAKHALRDLRLKGEVQGSRLGKRVVYGRSALLDLLARNRT